MAPYILGRFAQGLLAILAIVTLTFVMTRLSGDVVYLLSPPDATVEEEAEIRARLGLDRPLMVQWWTYVYKVAQGDFGRTIQIRPRTEVRQIVFQRLPATLQLGAVSFVVTLLLAIPAGVYAAVWRGSAWDWLLRSIAVIGQAAPAFWIGILLIWLFAVQWPIFPPGGRTGVLSFVLPSVTMGLFAVAGIARLTRSSMLEVLASDYIRTARAKGLPDFLVIWRHAFKNTLIPVVTFISLQLVGTFLLGSVVVEVVFAWPGLGRLLIDAVMFRDYPLVQGIVILIGAGYVCVNLAVDVLYGYLDPRIKAGRG